MKKKKWKGKIKGVINESVDYISPSAMEPYGLENIEIGLKQYLQTLVNLKVVSTAHVDETPQRFIKALEEFFSGSFQEPAHVLMRTFPANGHNEMVIVKDMDFTSFCAHHLLPFSGTVNFAYIPDKRIVGLSKIPRLIEILSHRPQVQEDLTTQIADVFMRELKPKGCAVLIQAEHLCMKVRGIRKQNALTETIAIRGCFTKGVATKQEFLSRISK